MAGTRKLNRALSLSLFLSGASGLLFQVVWIRQLSLILGSSTQAITAVLVAFMGGMAAGAWLLGPRADRAGPRGAVTMYAFLQLGILVSAAVLTFLNPLLMPLMGTAYTALGPGPVLTAARFVVSLLLLLIPSALMGATLPALTRSLADRLAVGTSVGRLYASNTLGGVAGVLASGFLLIPALGVRLTAVAGVALCALAALVALALGAPAASSTPPGRQGRSLPEGRSREPRSRGEPALLLAAASAGLCMLAAEVIWTRVLVRGLFNNSYAVATMLAAVLTGIALGSWMASGARRVGRPRRRAMICLSVLLFWLPASTVLMRLVAPLLERFLPPSGLAVALCVRYLPAFLIMLPASTASGALFPTIAQAYTPDASSSGRGVGVVSAVNTAGAVVGSIVATFVLLPLLGTRWSLLVLSLPLAASLIAISRRPLASAMTLVSPLLAGAALLTLASGRSWPMVQEGYRLLFYDEPPGGEVVVTQSRHAPSWLVIDVGGSRASTTTPEGCLKNRLMAYFPMLLHPQPRSVAVICFGTGITAGTATLFPDLERLDCIEINSAVIGAAELFEAHNHSVLRDGRTNLVIEDGRNHLLGTETRYDVITEEPMHPALSGVVALYTREYYQLGRERLSDGGLMAQWLPLYAMSPADCRMVVRTFLDVFPECSLWLLGRDAMLVGRRNEPIEPLLVMDGLTDSVLSRDLRPFGLDVPSVFLACHLMGPLQLEEYASGGATVTDDMPLLEYSAPRAVYRTGTVAENLGDMLTHRVPPTGAHTALGDRFDEAWRAVGLFYLAEAARDTQDLRREAMLLSQASEICPELLIARSRLAASLNQSARILLERNDVESAWTALVAANRAWPDDPSVLSDLAVLLNTQGRFEEAYHAARRALEIEPGSVSALNAFGRAALGSGLEEEASAALRAADSLSLH